MGILDVLGGRVPQNLLDLVPETERQAIKDQASANYWRGFLATPQGSGLLARLGNADTASQGTVKQYLDVAGEAARLAEANRVAQNRRVLERAARDATEGPQVDSGGNPTLVDDNGNVMPGVRVTPGGFNYQRYIQNPAVAGALATDPKTLEQLYGRQIEFVNGVAVDKRNVMPGFQVPKVSENMVVQYDAQGRPYTVALPGAAQAVGTLEGVKADAQERSKARYATERVYNPVTGQTEFRSRLDTLNPRDGASAIADPGPLEAEVAKKNADVLTTGFDKARSAKSALEINSAARPFLEKAITGFGAEEILGVARALNAVGLVPNATVADTEAFALTKARTVLDTVKQLGSGVSISNADRDFAERIAGGKITLNKETIIRLMNIEDKIAKQAINSHNSTVNKLFTKDRPTIGGAPADYWRVDVPGQSVVVQNPGANQPAPANPAAPAQPANRPSLNEIFNPKR